MRLSLCTTMLILFAFVIFFSASCEDAFAVCISVPSCIFRCCQYRCNRLIKLLLTVAFFGYSIVSLQDENKDFIDLIDLSNHQQYCFRSCVKMFHLCPRNIIRMRQNLSCHWAPLWMSLNILWSVKSLAIGVIMCCLFSFVRSVVMGYLRHSGLFLYKYTQAPNDRYLSLEIVCHCHRLEVA